MNTAETIPTIPIVPILKTPITNECINNVSVNPYVMAHNLAVVIVTVNGHKIQALLDLGATRTVINHNLVSQLALKLNNSAIKLQCANSDLLVTKGEAVLNMTIADYTFSANAIVCPNLAHKIIIGCDIISTLDYDRKRNFVILNGHKIKRFFANRGCPVRAPKSYVIPAGCQEYYVDAKNPLYSISDCKECIVQPIRYKSKTRYKFCTSELFAINNSTLPVCISNNTNSDVIIRKNSILGTAVPAENDTICGLSPVADTDAEKFGVAEFQQNRRLKYSINNSTIPNVDLSHVEDSRKEELTELFTQYNLAFQAHPNDLGKIFYWRYTIPLLDETKDCYERPRPIPIGLTDQVKKEFKKWEDNGLVEEAWSPNNIPVLVVRKKDKSVRLALDARKLNNMSVKDRFPMPSISTVMLEIGQKLASAEEPLMSCYDLSRAFNQLVLSETDRPKVAFSIFNKHYQARRLIYGMCNGPAAFSRLMSTIFAADENIYVFIDDIFVVSGSWVEHKAATARMLKMLINLGLILDPKKAQCLIEQATFLRETITKSGRMPSSKHVDPIINFPAPKTRRELKTYLGLCVFEQKFIPNSSVILKPLHMLSSPKSDFVWEEHHQRAFDNFNAELATTTGVNHRNVTYPLVLTTDASLEAAGGVLSQINSKGDYEPLGFFSRAFNDAERRKSARHREAIAIKDAVQHFEFRLLGNKFIIETDHQSLIWLSRERLQSTLDMRMINVYAYLAAFDFEIRYCPNTTSQIRAADALSRAPEKITLAEIEKRLKESNVMDHIFCLEHMSPEISISPSECPNEQINAITRNGLNTAPESAQNDPLFTYDNNKYFSVDLQKLQLEDKFCKDMITKLSCNGICKSKRKKNRVRKTCRSCQKSKNYIIQNQLLYNTKLSKNRLVLPNIIAVPFLEYYHTAQVHPGALALSKLVAKNLFVHNLQGLTKDISKKCFTCIRVKPRPRAEPEKVSIKPSANYPMSSVCIDLIDYNKRDASGKQYLLVFCCSMTDYIDGECLPNKQSITVTKAILKLALRYGAFNEYISDNGTEMKGYFRNICEKLNINHIKISPYNSRANRCERANRMIRIKQRLLNLNKSNWSEAFDLVKFSLNHSPRAKLAGLTPFEACFGRSVHLPYTLDETLEQTSKPWTAIAAHYFNTIYPSLVSFQLDRLKIIEGKADSKNKLNLGDKVLIFQPKLDNEGKMSVFWNGPLTIVKVAGVNSYVAKCVLTGKTYRRHRRHMRFLPPQSPERETNFEPNSDPQNITSEQINPENVNNIYFNHFEPDLLC